MAGRLQHILNIARKVFSNPIAPGRFSTAGIDDLRHLIDQLTPHDVGITPVDIKYNKLTAILHGTPKVHYIPLHECADFTMGVFSLPMSSSIPMHDHPGMTVLSKLLYGKLRVRALDWLPHKNLTDIQLTTKPKHARMGRVVQDNAIITNMSPTSVALPEHSNVHSFSAMQASAIFDILAPPYNDAADRSCNYYREVSVTDLDDDIEEDSDEEEEDDDDEDTDDEDEKDEHGKAYKKSWLYPATPTDFVCERAKPPSLNLI
eukprot:TRINITY_DN7100_c0_g1_i2.p1 TRINITY_DN7100_c0_g1~~TRINITY_DN7100_c0_g1_i2.p1  ORF type:complete len:274 (+),score=82.26 TRINITY_DN7100_c0_g1_i2:42-824(+)